MIWYKNLCMFNCHFILGFQMLWSYELNWNVKHDQGLCLNRDSLEWGKEMVSNKGICGMSMDPNPFILILFEIFILIMSFIYYARGL